MRSLRLVWIVLVLISAAISGTELHSALKRDTSAARKLERELQQCRVSERKRQETNIDWVRSRAIGGDESHPADFNRTIIRESAPPQSGYAASALVPPPPSPGIEIGRSSYDYQHNSSQGYQVGRTSGANVVHFVWMGWHQIPSHEANRTVYYNAYTVSTNSLYYGTTGSIIALGLQARAGYANLDIGLGNRLSVSMHQREDVSLPYNPWHLYFSTDLGGLHIDDGLGGYAAGGCPEVLWPRNAASRDAGDSGVWHLIAHSNTNDCATDLLWYWRYNGAVWAGPVVIDSTPQISYVIADDPNSNKLAVAVHVSNHSSMMGINNVAYLQSLTDGVGWINNTEAKTKTVITNYNNEDGPGAWLHLTTTYDNSSVLHIMFDEQQDANDNALTAIRHWNSSRNTIRPVALNYAETPLLTGIFNLNLAKVTMGIGDGATVCGGQTNNNYVYATYIKFGGSTAAEQADASLGGYYNGELYLSVSNSGGNTWAPPVNLSNTKTPYCNPGSTGSNGEPQRPDSVCRSEHWATIGRVVGDIDIFFISDRDAGGIPQGEGSWQMNPVHYYRIPGGTPNSQFVCPAIAASIEVVLTETEECEYHAPQSGSNDETMYIINLGNATLVGNISVADFPGAPTLTLSGGDGPFSIPAGSPDIVKTVTMSSNGAPEGLYHGEITITHNDLTPPDPRVFPIDFFVFNDFSCPEDEVLKTGVASPGSLALEVESNGRFGSQNAEGGLWRHADSSSSIFDASLLIAHGSQAPDTTVFRRFYDNPANGQFGFRALGDMIVDTATYGSGDGCATAVARMCTRDSVVGIQVEWVFPQGPDDDELVMCRYKIYRHNSTPINDLAVGILIDADAIPAARLGSIQNGVANTSGVDGTRNLVWVGGVDTADHIPSATNTSTRFRGGLAVPDGFAGAALGDGPSDLQVGGGPKDEFLYGKLQSLTGTEPYPDDADLYMLVALDRGQSIAVGETLTYVLVYASDTISEASFKATVDRGIDLATYPNLCRSGCNCICAGDPFCDGVVANIQDVVVTVNVAFRGMAPEIDPDCPYDRTDVNCNGSSEVIDVVKVVNVAFRGANAATEFCVPCQ